MGLDPTSRRQLLEYVLELRLRRQVGVLWATHLVDEAEAANRVVILHRGKVLRQGTPAGIVADTGAGSLADAFS